MSQQHKKYSKDRLPSAACSTGESNSNFLHFLSMKDDYFAVIKLLFYGLECQ